MKTIPLNRQTGEILLAAVIIARATSFLFSKIVLESMGPMTLLAIRSLIAFAFLTLLFRKRLMKIQKSTLLRGALLGGTFFAVMMAELFSLQTTASSTVSFLENTAIVFVPIFQCILHRTFPRLSTVLSLTVTMAGIALLTVCGNGFSFSMTTGELLSMLAAILYAIAILLTDRLSRQDDSFLLGILQVGFMGIFALIAAFVLETPRLPADSTEWGCILMLAFVCSGFGFTLQPVAQSYTTAERAGLFCALSPVAAAILGWLILKEAFGITGILGAGLVMAGILISTLAKQINTKKT